MNDRSEQTERVILDGGVTGSPASIAAFRLDPMAALSQMPREAAKNPEDYKFAVWGTQGGGLVREVGADQYIFVEKPDCPGLDVGDSMPREWSIIPANQAARRQMNDD